MNFEPYLLLVLGILLAGIGASYFRDGCAHVFKCETQDRVLGFAALLVSVTTLTIGWSHFLERVENQGGLEDFNFISLLSLLWPLSFATGWNSQRLRRLRPILVIVATALAAIWLIAHDGRFSSADILLAIGLVFWLATFAATTKTNLST